MSDDEIDMSQVDWTEIEEELEALEFIFPDEMTIHFKRPYKMDIMINSNSCEEENHLKMLLILEIPHDYPQQIPFIRLKNQSPDFLDNKILDQLEQEAREVARDTIGYQMLFSVADHLRSGIADINEVVLNKY